MRCTDPPKNLAAVQRTNILRPGQRHDTQPSVWVRLRRLYRERGIHLGAALLRFVRDGRRSGGLFSLVLDCQVD